MIDYQKARDETCTSRNSPSSCLFCEEFDWALGTVSNIEPLALHDSLVGQESNLPPAQDWRGASRYQIRPPK